MSSEGSLRPLCLFGAGGHGRVLAAQVARFRPREIRFADQRKSVTGLDLAWHEIGAITGCDVTVAIGDNALRRNLQEQIAPGAVSAALVMEPARCFALALGEGSQILAGAIVNPGARIGRGVILNSGAIVEHDCDIGDFCHLAPGSVMGGGARLGAGSLLGTNATILPGISVCAHVRIGAGAVVTRDITAPGTYAGLPARAVPE